MANSISNNRYGIPVFPSGDYSWPFCLCLSLSFRRDISMRWLIRRYVLLLSFRLWRVAGWWRLSFCCCCWLGMRLVDGMVGNRLLCGYHWLCSSLTFASVLDMGCCWLGVWDWLDGIGFSFNVVATNSSRRMCWRRLYLGCFCPESRLRIWCVFFFWLVFEMFYSSDCHTFFFFVVGFSMGDFLIGARAVVLPFPLFRWHRVLISLVFCNSTSSRCSKPMWSRHYRNVRRSCRISSWDIISRFRLVLPSLVSCWIFFLGALFFQEGFRFAKTLDDVLDARVFSPALSLPTLIFVWGSILVFCFPSCLLACWLLACSHSLSILY